MKADYVDRLYGVPKEDKPFLREMINGATRLRERNVIPLHKPIPSPEEMLFGATQEAEKYGFRQRGDYFFVKQTPALVMDKVVERLEEMISTIDLPPLMVDKTREEVMKYVNYVTQTYGGKDAADLEIPISYFVERLDSLTSRIGRKSDVDIFSAIRDITHVLESGGKEAKILPWKRNT